MPLIMELSREARALKPASKDVRRVHNQSAFLFGGIILSVLGAFLSPLLQTNQRNVPFTASVILFALFGLATTYLRLQEFRAVSALTKKVSEDATAVAARRR
ncbi:hypothetical protein LTR94_023675 [Friedmanniomyces endolithicus]|nr:hypothetical protein LTR94_023675 [Friedmanniomyces endolithicus]